MRYDIVAEINHYRQKETGEVNGSFVVTRRSKLRVRAAPMTHYTTVNFTAKYVLCLLSYRRWNSLHLLHPAQSPPGSSSTHIFSYHSSHLSPHFYSGAPKESTKIVLSSPTLTATSAGSYILSRHQRIRPHPST